MANSIDLHITFLQKQQEECANDYDKANKEWIDLVVDLKQVISPEQIRDLINKTASLENRGRMQAMYQGMQIEAEK